MNPSEHFVGLADFDNFVALRQCPGLPERGLALDQSSREWLPGLLESIESLLIEGGTVGEAGEEGE